MGVTTRSTMSFKSVRRFQAGSSAGTFCPRRSGKNLIKLQFSLEFPPTVFIGRWHRMGAIYFIHLKGKVFMESFKN
jgi:hypothetical protein